MDRPAIVGAVAVGTETDLAIGNARAPIVVAVRYIDAAMLNEISGHLLLTNLHKIDEAAAPPDQHGLEFADAQGSPISRFAWKPTQPGGTIVGSVLPFIAVALGGFALLVGLILRYMRRAAEEIRAGELQLRHLALHDPVCGLPNRIYFGERLETVINDMRAGGETAAVFYIDLDHFKDVNDTLGHHIGDELILSVTQRLSHIMRGEDLVARLGGDEFAIITHCASDSYSLQAIAGRIIAAVCAPYMISGHNIIIGASIGIAVIDRRARDAADILRYADMALYRAKNEGRNRACIYDAAMDADLSNRKLLEGDLLYAIKNDGLAAAYQPIMNSSGEKVIGVEALARWNHPTVGQIPPSQFIPIAEHSGLIIDLGEWMLRRACLDGRAWPNLTIAVNVSPLQFRRSDFVEVVERILAETEFDANRLELELTESTLLGQPRHRGTVDAAAESHRRALCARRFRHRLFEPALSAPLPVRQAQDRFELRELDREGARCRGHRPRCGQPRPRSRHEGDRGGRRDGRAASLPARRRRAFDAGLPLRQARHGERHQCTARPPRQLPRPQPRPGSGVGELTTQPSFRGAQARTRNPYPLPQQIGLGPSVTCQSVIIDSG